MRRYLAESIKGLFESIPLDGVLIIVGGENFNTLYAPLGVEPKHKIARCEQLGGNRRGQCVQWPRPRLHDRRI